MLVILLCMEGGVVYKIINVRVYVCMCVCVCVYVRVCVCAASKGVWVWHFSHFPAELRNLGGGAQWSNAGGGIH